MSATGKKNSSIIADLNKLTGEMDHDRTPGLGRLSNPFRPGTKEYDQWQEGWDEAHARDQETRDMG
jgi:hypothetical protein